MSTHYPDGAQFANCFRTDAPAFVPMEPLARGGTAAARLTYSRPGHGPARIPPQSAVVVLSLMQDLAYGDLAIDGCPMAHGVLRNGEFAVFDLHYETVIDVQSPFDFVYLYFPHSAVDRLEYEHNALRVVESNIQPGVSAPDPVITQLAACLQRELARRDRASEVLTEHVTLALQAHFAQRYWGVRIRSNSTRGALAPWQLRLAKELLTDHLDHRVSVAQIAAECRLSPGHFARAFKCSTGISPYRWQLNWRIEKGANLLRHSTLSVAQIALICGFCDQSHLTREFEKTKGATPSGWRRRSTERHEPAHARTPAPDIFPPSGGCIPAWRDESRQN
jgi:AraC family transcriptional regulator